MRRRTHGPRLVLTARHIPHTTLAIPAVAVPRLADRACDIPLIVRALAPAAAMTPAALALLEQQAWPGNLTELRHVVERALVLTQDGPITREHLPAALQTPTPADHPVALPAEGINLETVEISLIRQALAQAHGSKRVRRTWWA